MLQDIILYTLLGLIISSIIFYLYHAQYRKKVKQQLDKMRELEIEVSTLREREKNHIQNQAKREEEYTKRLEAQKEEHQNMLNLQSKSFSEQIQAMKTQFQALSEDITKQRAEELSKSNKSSMDDIINPLKETIEKMEKSLKDNNEKGAERVGSLKEQITNLINHTTEIGSKADHLSQALRMKSKIQGNWGETILETLLQSEGLEEYIHYEAQKTLKDKQNNIRYPDFVLKLPDNRVVVIDAKVSLNAYTDYYSTDDPAEKRLHMKSNYESVKNHIDKLADKEYFKLIDKSLATPDFVMMFIPIPGALQLAYQYEEKLYGYATKKGVFLSSTQSIMPILWIIKDLWTQTKQEKNMENIVEDAKRLLDRLIKFFDEFEQIEISLKKAQKAYDDANTKLRGRQGALVSARNIANAGIKPTNKAKLPEPLYDDDDEEEEVALPQ